jgi:TonB family protein
MRMAARGLAASALLCAVISAQQEPFAPARLESGTLPPLAPFGSVAVGGGEVFVEVSVSNSGQVTSVTPLRTTPPFTDMVIAAVRGWQFSPAENEPDRTEGGGPGKRQPVASRVFVAALVRPPTINTPTLGEPPKDVASESDETPFPLVTSVPTYPIRASQPGVVLVEVQVGLDGSVASAAAIRSAPPFDDAALAAVRQWKFRPSRVRGRSVLTRAYVMFGFPSPITSPLAR